MFGNIEYVWIFPSKAPMYSIFPNVVVDDVDKKGVDKFKALTEVVPCFTFDGIWEAGMG